MHFSTALAAIAAAAPLVNAHGSPLPKIVGLNPKDLKARDLLSNLGARFAETHEFAKANTQPLKARQDDRECGAGIGSCAAGVCCSQSGYCGNDDDYCYAPGCDYAYGPGCPDNATPAGTNTSSIPRTKLGSVQYGGEGIYSCVTPGTIALTYDDGPQKTFTAHILDLMKTYNAKATFFITGNNINKGQIDTTQEFIDVIKRMDAEGHQLASHTWTHLDLSAISSIDRKNQMWKLEMALRNIVGKIPTYMRPPYSSCTGQCQTDMAALGYHVTYFDVDTDDYNQDSPNQIQRSKDWFKGNITKGGATAAKGAKWLDIQHDIHDQTANNLTEYMLKTLTDLGYKAVTVGECLGDPVANWYRAADGAGTASSTVIGTATRSSSAPASTGTKKVTTDATCGGTNQYTCLGSSFGNCCSAAGWCGTTTDYCGTGCQSGFGNCGSNGGVSSSKAASSTPKPATSTPKPVTSTPKPATSTKASASPSPSAGGKVSTDGSCGGANGFTCSGSAFGSCCSQYGWCGSTTDHCGASCNSAFGTCSGSGSASSVKVVSTKVSSATPTPTKVSSAAPTPTKKASTDGTCAGAQGFTCTGSSFGNCCSQYGWCGSTTGHCGTGCNKSFGTCT